MILKSILLPFRFLIDYILPPRCLSCAELTITDNGFCPHCFQQLNSISKPYCQVCGRQLTVSILDNTICGKCTVLKPQYDIIRSLFIFDEHSRKIIHAFKYYDKTIMAKIFAKILYDRYELELSNIDLIIPVPMHKLKRLLRTYNHAHLLAQELKKNLAKPLCHDLLIKHKWTKSQTNLSKKSRLKNIYGSISYNQKYCIRGKNILLVDDVITTGATIQECSKLLKNFGAQTVYVVTIARA